MHRSLKALSRSHKDQVTYLILCGAMYPLFFVACALRRVVAPGAGTIFAEAKDKTSIAAAYAFMG